MYLTSGDVDRIVYFVRYRRGKYVLEPHVDFGIISDVYESDRKVYVDYLTMYDCMLINGISIQQFDRTPMKKLPKGWTYNAELYTITWDHTKPESKIDKRYPATIKRAFDSGVLIRCDESHEYRYKIDAVVTKDGYYVKKTPRGLYNDGWRPVGNTYSFDDVFATFEEAARKVDEINAEFYRQAEMADEEWSMEQITKTVNHWARVYGISDEMQEKYLDEFSSFKNLVDLEVRISLAGNLQWKYWKQKRWKDIVLEVE